MGRRLALVGEAAPTYDAPDADPDAIQGELYEVTDTSVTFAGYYATPKFDRAGQLQIVLTIDPDSPVSNRDLLPLRGRLLAVTLEPRRRTKTGTVATSPTVDPILDANLTARVDRMIARWVDGWDDADLEPDPFELEWL